MKQNGNGNGCAGAAPAVARLEIGRVERTEEIQFTGGKAMRALLCAGRVDGVEQEFVVRLWAQDGESFEGAEEAVAGRTVTGQEPKREEYRRMWGARAFDWRPERKPRGGRGGWGAGGGLAAAAREFLAEWVADRKLARAMERERFEFERRARVVELTLLAMQQSEKETVEFEKVRNWVARQLGA